MAISSRRKEEIGVLEVLEQCHRQEGGFEPVE